MRQQAWQYLAPKFEEIRCSCPTSCGRSSIISVAVPPMTLTWFVSYHLHLWFLDPNNSDMYLSMKYVYKAYLLYMDQTVLYLCNIICLIFVHVYKLCEMRFMSPSFRLPTSRKIIVGDCRLMEHVHHIHDPQVNMIHFLSCTARDPQSQTCYFQSIVFVSDVLHFQTAVIQQSPHGYPSEQSFLFYDFCYTCPGTIR